MDYIKCLLLWVLYQSTDAINVTIHDTIVPTVNPLTNITERNGEFVYPCYVSVVVYKSPDLTETYSKGANVYAVTRERSDTDKYIGYSSSKTDRNGHACVLSFCRKQAILFVETGSKSTGNLERLYAAPKGKQAILRQFTFDIQTRMEEIYFNVRSWGTILGKSGPVYNEFELNQCLNAGTKNFHFVYSFLAQAEKLTPTLPLDTYVKPLSWYFLPEGAPGYQACFMKIKVKIRSYQSMLHLSSYDNTASAYGTFEAGPKASPTNDSEVKAACMEFRCTVNGLSPITHVVGNISFPSAYCCKIETAPTVKGLQSNDTFFSIDLRVDDNYGPKEGIYKDSTHDRAKANCYTGSDQYYPPYDMNPTTNYFISYDCTKPCALPKVG
ncbi:uncharacterized protein LOC123537220 [Mercenaria mercenaria]|uniref:uncharacterized protein LOC123537220 n=1 Tax=Mercenaria mercenaria TaxID=6596 RepID=UPI00234E6D2B|nr:uncharacterized protein LOC123537220 [Mercenaria mercenaria]